MPVDIKIGAMGPKAPLTEVEVMARVERRRNWSDDERAALLAELDVPGSSVPSVARRHGIAPSLLYGWRAARKAKMGVAPTAPMEFMPLGVFGRADDEGPALIAAPAPVTPKPSKPAPSRGSSVDERPGLIEIDLPNGARVRVDAFVNQRALHRVADRHGRKCCRSSGYCYHTQP